MKKSTLAATALVLLCGLSGDATAQFPSRNSGQSQQPWNGGLGGQPGVGPNASNPYGRGSQRFDGRRDEDDRRHSSHLYHPYIHIHVPHVGGTAGEASAGRQGFTPRAQNVKVTTPQIKVPTRPSSVGSTGTFSRGRGWLAGIGAAVAAGLGALFGRRKES